MTTSELQAVPVAQEIVAVAQADRDAAANADVMNAMTNAAIRYGRCDNIALVQAFARHRLARLTPIEGVAASGDALAGIVKFITDYRSPWGSWKTAWWEDEVSDDAAMTDDNAMMHIANLANRALSSASSPSPAIPEGTSGDRYSKDWCMKMAALEGSVEIGAGALDHPLRLPEGTSGEGVVEREAIARIIIGPRNDVPRSEAKLRPTLRQLQDIRWEWSSEQERKEALWIADRVIAALTPDVTQTRESELVAALEFYADRDSDGYRVDVTNYGLSTEEGEIVRDGGARARAALPAGAAKGEAR